MATPSIRNGFRVTKTTLATLSQILLLVGLIATIYQSFTAGHSLPATSLEVFLAANLVVSSIVARMDR